MDNKAFEDVSIKAPNLNFKNRTWIYKFIDVKPTENKEQSVVDVSVNVTSAPQVGKMRNDTDASSCRTGYQGQMEILPTLHELHNPMAANQQQVYSRQPNEQISSQLPFCFFLLGIERNNTKKICGWKPI